MAPPDRRSASGTTTAPTPKAPLTVRSVCWAVGLLAPVFVVLGAVLHAVPRRVAPRCYLPPPMSPEAPLCNFNNTDLDVLEGVAWAGAVGCLLVAVVALMWQLRRGSSVNDPGEEA